MLLESHIIIMCPFSFAKVIILELLLKCYLNTTSEQQFGESLDMIIRS